jgi:hypothetical protein
MDPDGNPHTEHCDRVADSVEGVDAKSVAYLHDVLEDADQSVESLQSFGLSPQVVRAVEILTRRHRERYLSYIERVANALGESGYLARIVKVADLNDNLARSRASNDAERIARYEQALAYLTGRSQVCPFCRGTLLASELRDGVGDTRNYGGWIVCRTCKKEWTDPEYWETVPGRTWGLG